MDRSDAAIRAEFCLQGSVEPTPSSYVTSFSTGDIIEGIVTICARNNTRFHDINISLLGDEHTTVRRATAHRQFLNIPCHIPDSLLPASKVFAQDQKYPLAFSFTVPDHLPLNVCDHDTDSHIVKHAHLRLPPSFGDPMVAGYGGKLRNDFAPQACRIVYTIQLTIRHKHLASGRINTTLTKELKLRIKPATSSQPFPFKEAGFCTQGFPVHGKPATVLGRSKSKLGTLSMAIEEPPVFCIPLRDSASLVSSVRISVIYTPNADPTFPRFRSVGGHLSSTTFFTTDRHSDFPEKEKGLLGTALNFDTVQFLPFSRSFASLDWDNDGRDRYTATLLVPITLPRQNFIPTFHTCLISRVYTLLLKVAVKDGAPFEFELPAHVFAREDPSHLPSYVAAVGLNGGTGASFTGTN